ncbi:MAG: MmcQ/YjbR family DNA-binding protein [Saprospiraceae bacterium]|nr:MmcQ/YjbR family DNA-binding protein [Saprospiraceae bacterium]MCF8248579.1 MmcQ/YjbR family DNA-binding protein [Saprospiraceae bacterium]MCF8280254.1 MmcQ/YjbR family DNA-binding protein [Bacteroidales bacterium]MCF8310312.1 MmcQ/YjbR family DNA-binding protein [Saprospiraceae bacterium]MCF8439248.1 MmcQ/YjbR family DNA-binding protein [Saprospiraceae bacterium]
MNIETFRDYCLRKKGVEEAFPFDKVTLVFKVMGKIFAITGLDADEFKVNLKCEPSWAIELRELHPDDILPGWHMNKQHWNTVHFETGLDDAFLIKLVDHSYDLIVSSLPKKTREEFAKL